MGTLRPVSKLQRYHPRQGVYLAGPEVDEAERLVRRFLTLKSYRMQAEIITIGDEILIGQIVDTNSAWIGQQLNAIGISLKQISSIADSAADITTALSLTSGRADLILVTGGLGPTKDDVTKQALAAYFGCGLHRDPEVLAHVQAIFSRSGRPMLEANRKQPDVLDICEVLFNQAGTAPAMWVTYKRKHYIVMPGVPH